MRGRRREARGPLALAMIVAGGCARSPASGGKPNVVAVAVETIGDWEKMQGVTLALRPTFKNCPEGHLGAVDAVVKARHTRDVIAVRVSWPDATRSDTHKSLV